MRSENTFIWHKSKGYFYFRIFGYGLHFKNITIQSFGPPLLFSDRMNLEKGKLVIIFKYKVKILKPTTING